ncbi:AI-2 transport protein TqsA [Planctomycetes bacterium Poly30]|uniref:AI-2 transport protein TqsA n=1 Tax=Saltatorellus ferox TaxID=2528018 RepID=A0A518EYC4_9BACT|nr:AI-2 transport protein TqsA [Planctomycetes bacterium Poly30]
MNPSLPTDKTGPTSIGAATQAADPRPGSDQRPPVEVSPRRKKRAAHSIPLIVIAGGVGLGLLWWLRPVLAPIAIAWLAKIALTPLVRFASRRRIPAPATAGLLVVLILGTTVGGALSLSEPANQWLRRLPKDIRTLQQRWEEVNRPSKEMIEVVDAVDELVDSAKEDVVATVRVVDTTPFMVKVFNQARGVLAQFALFLVLLYFMLANDRVLMKKWTRIVQTSEAQERVRKICATIESQCGSYLISISLINAGLGLAVGLATAALGLPNPILWGAVAAILNFVPFLGAAVGIAVVLVVGISSTESLGAGVLPGAAYLFLTSIEGLLITPSIVGRSIRLSPVAVLMWLMLWGWLWGLAGALLAVPLLAALAIVCRNVPRWRAVATLVEA